MPRSEVYNSFIMQNNTFIRVECGAVSDSTYLGKSFVATYIMIAVYAMITLIKDACAFCEPQFMTAQIPTSPEYAFLHTHNPRFPVVA